MKQNKSVPHPGKRSLAVAKTAGEEEKPGAVSVMIGALRALPFTLFAGFLLLLIASAIAYAQPDPDSFGIPLAVASAGLSALIGGFLNVRFNHGQALLSGLSGGILFMGTLMILSLCFFRECGSGYSSTVTFLLHAGIVLLEIVGAFLGLPRKKSAVPGKHKAPKR